MAHNGNSNDDKLTDTDVEMTDDTVTSTTTTTTAPSGLTVMTCDEDEARAEATFSYTFEHVSQWREGQQFVSEPGVIVRSLPWKILAMPRMNNRERFLGYFLQANGDSDNTAWSCSAFAELRIIPLGSGKLLAKKITHTFFSKENDWGFGSFLLWKELLDPDSGYLVNDCMKLEVFVRADAPKGTSWDSKKHTGCVGLKNQGATCYMNSLLQTLFFTNKLRRAVYQMPTEQDDPSRSVPFALQRVFYELQFTDKPVATKKLTKSFGWDNFDAFMQHDVQELSRVLLDNIENKMKATVVEGTIQKLFEGKTMSYIRCKHVTYESNKEEAFMDIQLNVKNKKDVHDAFEDYIAVETLSGDNKYDADKHGMQEAEKGVTFVHFPPVLHLHLLRFMYDPTLECNVKINDRFEFPERLKLEKYLKEGTLTADAALAATVYRLHAVLVHSGDNHGGHYVVYISPKADGKWCKFDDDVVSRCTRGEAIENNFGGSDDEAGVRQSSNAYMLVYIRESSIGDILQDVTEEDIPSSLVNRLDEERKLETLRRKERSEAHLYTTIKVGTDEMFSGHMLYDLFDRSKAQFREFKVLKTMTVLELLKTIAQSMNFKPNQIRLWPFVWRQNKTFRPSHFSIEEEHDKQVQAFAFNTNEDWTIFVETLWPGANKIELPLYSPQEALLFLRNYDPRSQSISYCGHVRFSKSKPVRELCPILCKRAGYNPGTPLLIYEEVCENNVNIVADLNQPINEAINELNDGDIILYQKAFQGGSPPESLTLPTAKDYFREVYYRIDVLMVEKNKADTDKGFQLTMSQKWDYTRVVQAVAAHVNVDHAYIQLYKCQPYGESPAHAIPFEYDGHLREMLLPMRIRGPRKLFYQILTIPVQEMENRRQIRLLFLSENMKEEKEITLYPQKTACVRELIQDARKHIDLSPSGTGKLRLITIISHKIYQIINEDSSLDSLDYSSGRLFRLEEIPADQLTIVPTSDMLIPVVHFQREPNNTFGHPFLIKCRHEELFSSVKNRVQQKLDVSDKEYEKYKFALVTYGRSEYINADQNDMKINLRNFRYGGHQQTLSAVYLGLDHINKSTKRPRYGGPAERGVKIFN